MDNLVIIATLISELLAIVICLHAFFEQRFLIDRYVFGVIIIECAMMYLVNIGKLPRFGMTVVYLIMWLFCYVRFKMPLGVTTLKYFFGIAVCGLVEAVLSLPSVMLQTLVDTRILALAGSILLLAVVCALGTRISQQVKVLDYKNDRKLQGSVVFYIVAEGILIIDYNFGRTPLRVSMLIIVACIFIGYFYIVRMIQAKIEVEKKNLEMKLDKVYGKAYVELSSLIRKRQHDFKNQLGAIYSMHISASSLEELVAMQRQYGDRLLEDCRYDSILTNCNHPILAGYLYHRCLSCENKGIKVDYDIHIEQAESVFPLHELIEALGILIDNACENFDEFPADYPAIRLVLHESPEELRLLVANPSGIMKCSEIERMFQKDFSTKGERRGIGLTRLKELANLHGTEILVENHERKDGNWLSFELHIPK
ncbi:MAG: GHKL domain-containing protein [Roseburia sp.]|nr:GHKL domain-containing protein [Roseburia sp.]